MNFLASTSCTGDGLSTSSSSIKEGDCVIVYEGMNSMKAVYVSTKGRYDNRFGTFKHESWIGKPFGSKVTSSNKGASGWVLLLRPTPELWTQVLRHRTQILYLADISMVVTHLDLKPGSVVLESGTGSGSLTHSLVRAVAPTGHVHTFEFHAGRAEDAAAEFKQHGLSGLVTVTQRNIEELGFPDTLHGAADGVFLDLPAPHKVVPSAAACLRPNGRFCAFSPCIEQVQRTAEALSSSGFTDLITYECLLRECEVHRETLVTSLQLAEGPLSKRRRTDPAPPGPQPKMAVEGQQQQQQQQQPEAARPAAGEEAAGEEGVSGMEAATAAEAEVPAAAAAGGGGGASGVDLEDVGGVAGGKTGEKAGAVGTSAETACGQEANEPPQGQGQGAAPGCALAAAGDAAVGRSRVVSWRPSAEARGHTGYLIFARKFVCG